MSDYDTKNHHFLSVTNIRHVNCDKIKRKFLEASPNAFDEQDPHRKYSPNYILLNLQTLEVLTFESTYLSLSRPPTACCTAATFMADTHILSTTSSTVLGFNGLLWRDWLSLLRKFCGSVRAPVKRLIRKSFQSEYFC